jgi:hypothetical protein
MPGVGYVLGGILVSIGNPRTAYAVAGVGVLVLVLLATLARPRVAARSANGRPPGPPDIPLPEPLSPAPTLERERTGAQ